MIELSHIFTFEAAHFLPSADTDSHNRRIHGHSFKVEVILSGDINPKTGLIINLEEVADICHTHIHTKLDHYLLNDIKGLEHPTLEHISMWIYKELFPKLPLLKEVIIYRETCGQKCRFVGDVISA